MRARLFVAAMFAALLAGCAVEGPYYGGPYYNSYGYGYDYDYYGPAYYGSWGSYYSAGYAAVVDAGTVTANDLVTLETNLYDASREPDALVWSGSSETLTDQSRSGKKIDEVITLIVQKMKSSRVL